jgi:hypothetical protein
LQDLVADGRAGLRHRLDHFAPGVAPAIGKLERRTTLAIRLFKPIIAGVSIDLQHTVKAGEHLFCMAAATPGRVAKHHARRIGAAQGAIVARQRPQVAGLGLAPSRIEHRGGGLVHEQLAGALEQRGHPIDDGRQMKSGASHPIGQRRALDRHAVPGQNWA